jgi:hypothetical protein
LVAGRRIELEQLERRTRESHELAGRRGGRVLHFSQFDHPFPPPKISRLFCMRKTVQRSAGRRRVLQAPPLEES